MTVSTGKVSVDNTTLRKLRIFGVDGCYFLQWVDFGDGYNIYKIVGNISIHTHPTKHTGLNELSRLTIRLLFV